MAAQSDPQGAVRAQSTPLAADGLFDDEPASIRPPPVSAPLPLQPAPSIPPFSVAPAAAASVARASDAPAAPASTASIHAPTGVAQPVVATKRKGGATIALVFGAVALSAAAAGGFLFVKNEAKVKDDAVALSTPAPVATAPAVAELSKPAEPAAVAPAPAAPEPTLDPKALPSPQDVQLAAAAKKGGAPAPMATAIAAKAPAKEETPTLSQKDLPTAPAGPNGDLGAAMKGAVGADGKPVEATPAAGTTGPQFAAGSVPQKPSQGAVTGALGAVLPSARACLGPDDAVSRASITFTSAGTVQSVGVTGGAVGKPAEACIKGALTNAKLAPFAEPSYTANITVRH